MAPEQVAGSYFAAFTVANLFFAAVGASVFWGINGRTRLRAFILRDLIDWFDLKQQNRVPFEFAIFISLGCVVGVAVTQPISAIQAITAGFGWTGLFARK